MPDRAICPEPDDDLENCPDLAVAPGDARVWLALPDWAPPEWYEPTCHECGAPMSEHTYPGPGDCPASALLVPDWD